MKKSSAKNFLLRALNEGCANILHGMRDRYGRKDVMASAQQKVLRSFFKSDLPRRPPTATQFGERGGIDAPQFLVPFFR